jgi:hypothetical protein
MVGLTILVLALLHIVTQWWLDRTWEAHRTSIQRDVQEVEPLLEALEAYREDHGTYPRALPDLTPEYLTAIPPPPFEFPADAWMYASGPERVRGAGIEGPDENNIDFPEQVYALWVWVPTGYTPLSGLLSDALVYHSHEQYARFAYGGVLERIGGWAYYHE